MIKDFDNPVVDHPALTQFAGLAQEFCELVERFVDVEQAIPVPTVHQAIADLYQQGLRLPSLGVLYNDDDADDADDDPGVSPAHPDPDDMGHDAWWTLFQNLEARLGPAALYRQVFDPYLPAASDPEVTSSLADDIADIYRDLKRGIWKWERDEAGAALWEWRFGLENHWGNHATGALRALNARAAWHDFAWPSAE